MTCVKLLDRSFPKLGKYILAPLSHQYRISNQGTLWISKDKEMRGQRYNSIRRCSVLPSYNNVAAFST